MSISVSEPFFVQKTDLIAELKRTKDIPGIKKLKVERAQVEKTQEQNLMSEISKAFSVTKFVDQVSIFLFTFFSQETYIYIHVCVYIKDRKVYFFRCLFNFLRKREDLFIIRFMKSRIADSFMQYFCRFQRRTVREIWYQSGSDKCWPERPPNEQRRNSRSK